MNYSYEPWDIYNERIDSKGETRRGAALHREQSFVRRKLRHSLSYHIANVDGKDQEVAIINSDNLDIKTLFSIPGEDIRNGSYVIWNDFYWIVIAKDENTEVYTKTTMQQCNYLLKWIKDDGTIVERWGIINDGTKYLTGETVSSYNGNAMSLGDSRVQLTLPRDEETALLTRKNVFLVDDPLSPQPLRYRLSKPFKVGSVYGLNGPMHFMLIEENLEKDDNTELMVADYYKYYRRDGDDDVIPLSEQLGEKVWI